MTQKTKIAYLLLLTGVLFVIPSRGWAFDYGTDKWRGSCAQSGGMAPGCGSNNSERNSTRESKGNQESKGDKHFRWGKEYEEAGNLSAAAEEYRKAISYIPDGYLYHAGLGVVLWKLGRYNEAEAACITAIRLDSNHRSNAQEILIAIVGNIKIDILNNGFDRAHNEKDTEKSEALYRQYLLVNPTDPAALGNLGRALHIQGHYIEAEAAYREAIRYGSSNPEARENATSNLNKLMAYAGNTEAYKQLLAANEQGVAASQETTIEAIKGRSMRCFDDSRGCVYSNEHAFEKLVLAPRKSLSAHAPVPAALQRDRDFSELQQNKKKQEKKYKETYDALQAAWALKDSSKGDKGTIDILIAEQKNKLSMEKSAVRTTKIKIDKKYEDLGFTPPED